MVIIVSSIRHVLNWVEGELKRQKGRYVNTIDLEKLLDWLEDCNGDRHLVMRVNGEKEYALRKVRYKS